MSIPTLVTGCALWFDASDIYGNGAAVSNGTAISTWYDKSGNARNAISAFTTPQYYANGLATGYPALFFNQTQAFKGNVSITGKGLTIFAVTTVTNQGGSNRLLALPATAGVAYTSTNSMIFTRLGGTSITGWRSSVNNSSPSPPAYATPYLFETWYDSANGTNYNTVHVGGSTTVTASVATSNVNFGIQYFGLGTEYSNTAAGGECHAGYLSEIIVYNNTLSTTDRQKVEGYMAWKWGLQAKLATDHPYKSAAPNSNAAAAPTGLSAAVSSGQAVITFTPGSSTTTIVGYQYSTDGSTYADVASYTTTTATITGLTNGTTYTIYLKAVNAYGAGTASTSVSATPYTTPSAPTGLSAAPGINNVVISFTAGSTNGSAITNYQYSTDGGSIFVNVASFTSTTATITGLTGNGAAYTMLLRAVNAAGSSTASSSVSFTSYSSAGAPTSLVATVDDSQISVAFTAPTDTGGGTITNYAYSTNNGSTYTTRSPAATTSPLVITGLSNGTAYTVLLKAINGGGAGTASTSVVATPVGAPPTPTSPVATGGYRQITISFTQSSNGGSAITGYTYSTSANGTFVSTNLSFTSSSVTITGLADSTSYTYYLKVANAYGTSAASAAATTSTGTAAGAPTALVATHGDGQVSLRFTAGSTGGITISNYQYSLDGGSTFITCSPAQTASPLAIKYLVNNTIYSIAIRAVNGAGVGATSMVVTARPSAGLALKSVEAYTNATTSSTVFTIPATMAVQYSYDQIQVGWYAYSMYYGEKIGTITAISVGSNYTFTLGTLFRTMVNTTTGGFNTGNVNEYYFFADPSITVVSMANNTGSTGSATGTFTTSSWYNTTTNSGSNVSTISAVSVGYRMYNNTRQSQCHIGTVVAIDQTAKTITIDYPNFNNNYQYYFMAPTYISIYRPIIGAPLQYGTTNTYDSGSALGNGQTISPFNYIMPGFLCYRADTAAYVGVVRSITPPSNGRVILDSGTFVSGIGYMYLHPTYIISGCATNTSAANASVAVFTAAAFTATPNLASVAAGWRAYASVGDRTTFKGTVVSNNYPGANTITLDTGALVNSTTMYFVYGTVTTAVPGAPSALVSTAWDASAFVAFTAGAVNDTAITNYQVSTDGGATYTALSPAQTASPLTISGLTNGTTYSINIKAVNSIGVGSAASAAVSVTPLAAAAPDAPTSLVVSAGATQLSVSFTAGAVNRSYLTNYQYSTDGGSTFTACSPAVTSSPITITGLTNGTSYTVKLKAVNSVGAGAASAPVTGTPYDAPSAPSSLVITASAAQLSVAFTAPTSTNGSAITNYQYSTDNGSTFTACSPTQTTSPIVITGLTNGTTYTVVIRAVNAAGSGTASASATGMPFAAPAAPTISSIVPDTGALNVYFTAGSNNGATITNYQYSTDGGTTYTTLSPAATTSPFSISGLTNYTRYTVLLKAVNSVGAGTASASVVSAPTSEALSMTGSYPNSVANATTYTIASGTYTTYSLLYVMPGWYAYAADTGEIVGTVTANNGTTTITIGTLLRNVTNTTGGFKTSATGTYYFFAKSSITLTQSSTNTGTNNTTAGTFLTGFGTNQTTGAAITTANLSAVQVGWRCYGNQGSVSHVGTVTAVNSATGSVTIDLANFKTGTSYFFGDPTNMTVFRPVRGGMSIATISSPNTTTQYNFSQGLGNGSPTATDYILPGYLVYKLTDLTASIGVVKNINTGYIELSSGAYTTGGNYVFAHPDYYLSAFATDTSSGATTTKIFTSAKFTATSNLASVAAGWRGIYYDSGNIRLTDIGMVLTNNYPGANTITLDTATTTANSTLFFTGAKLVPSAPSSLVATASSGQVSVVFTASSGNGSTVTNYSYSTDGGATYTVPSPASTTSPIVITGLTNGTAYTILLKAINAIGSSAASSSVTSTPYTTPGAPMSLVATAGDGQASIAFVAPTDTGGDAITNYSYSTDGGTTYTVRSPVATTSPIVMSSLTNSTSYSIRLKAINAAGAGTASTSVSVMPISSTAITVPGAPTSLVATAGSGQVSLAFVAPTSTGGAAITNYKYSTNGGTSYVTPSTASTSSPIVITGLTNGTTYTILLKAVNSVGTGAASDSVTATPLTTPAAPTGLSTTAGDGQVSLSFTAGSANGSAITNYMYSTDGGATYSTFSPAQASSPVVITGLANSVTYYIKIAAINGVGLGSASGSTTGTPVSSGPPMPPTSLTAMAGNAATMISFAAGFTHSAVTNYMYSTDAGATYTACSPAQTASPVTISGLTNGSSYTVSLKAVSALGTSSASSSVVASPASAPGAPSSLTAVPGRDKATVVFVADGAARNYSYSLDGGATYAEFVPAQDASPVVIEGLTNGTAYSINLKGINEYGTGPAATASASVTPGTAPGAPSNLVITASDSSVSVAFDESPLGGYPITSHQYSLDGGVTYTSFYPAQASSPVVITGLTNGTRYTIQLKAINLLGIGPGSRGVPVVPAGVSGVPTGLRVVATSNTTATLSFTAGSSSGGSVTNYMVSTDGGSNYTAMAPAYTGSPIPLSGLTPGATYSIMLKEVTTGGTSAASAAAALTLTVPDAVTGLTATTETGQTSVSFTSTGPSGAAITNYAYSLDGGGNYTVFSPAQASSPVTITGLYDGNTYTIMLKAVNALGTSATGDSIIITPVSPESDPGIVAVDSTATITLATTYNGDTVVKYWYSIDDGINWIDPTNQIVIENLSNGVDYSMWYYGVTFTGTSPTYVANVSPVQGAASAPTITTITPATDGTTLSVAFTDPTSTGTSAITNYTYTTDNGTNYIVFAPEQTTSPLTISGTSLGVSYYVAIAAINSSGVGDTSTMVSVSTFVPCFARGTKILTNKGYRRIETLRPGDMVETLKHKFMAIHAIGRRGVYPPRDKTQRTPTHLFRCSPNAFTELFEDLVMTGYHARLQPSLLPDLEAKVRAVYDGEVYLTEDMYRIPICLDDRATVFIPDTDPDDEFEIFNFALDADDRFVNYGVYANGLLVESSSIRYMTELSQMDFM